MGIKAWWYYVQKSGIHFQKKIKSETPYKKFKEYFDLLFLYFIKLLP